MHRRPALPGIPAHGARQWQRDFLARPLAERRAEVENLRRRSAEAMQGKDAREIMDANPGAIRAALPTTAAPG
jgi:UDP-2,3-diacylglucosamine hydrolase